MKSILGKMILLLVILMLLFSINTKVFAWSEIIKDGKDFLGQADESEVNIDKNGLKNLSGYLYNILLAAGVVISVIVATVLGVQFMLGGAEGQAKVKEMIVPFVVGCIIVFGGFGFWKIAIVVGERLEGTTQVPNTPSVTENKCSICGTEQEPVYNTNNKRYECPSCGNPRAPQGSYQPDFSGSKCSICGTVEEPVYDEANGKFICPSCGNLRY